MSDTKKHPVERITLYPVKAAIWKNETADGKTLYSYSIERSYKDEKGEYQSSGSYLRMEALLMEKVAARVFNRMSELEAADHAAARQRQGAA